MLFDSHDAFGQSHPFTFYFARNDFLEEETEAAEAYLEDYASLVEYVTNSDNRDSLVSTVIDAFDAPEELYNHYYYVDEYDYYHPSPPKIDVDDLQFVVDELTDLGFVDESTDMSQHVDNGYLP